MYEQLNIFDLTLPLYKIDKPIRLIELFAGVGSQAMALRDLGADFEHYRVVEFDKYAVASYNAIHGTEFTTLDIRKITGKDLGITDTERYCYIMTYSFPCQDLSVAGRQKGMKKGSGTRSGLLWEVERILNECDELPQVLLMENVTQVHNENNMPDFQKWISFLLRKGYSNYWQDLNAKDYGVAQNRGRCFMISILGEWNYKFPKKIPLKKSLADYLEDDVDEKYYINNENAKKLIQTLIENNNLKSDFDYKMEDRDRICVDMSTNNPKENKIGNCVKAKDYGISDRRSTGNGVIVRSGILGSVYAEVSEDFQRGICEIGRTVKAERHDLAVVELKERRLGNVYGFDGGNYAGNVYDDNALSPTIRTFQGGNQQPMIVAMRGRNKNNPSDRTAGLPTEQRLEANSRGICNTLTSVQKDNMLLEVSQQYRIRKLTPLECWRLMGFSDEDFRKAEKVNSNSQLYKQAGNSIVKNALMAILGQLLQTQRGGKNFF